MKVFELEIPDIKIIIPQIFNDPRGSFQESYNKRKLEGHDLNFNFVQDNYSITTKKGTIRGLHFQTSPMAQTKLIRVLSGHILDVVVDIRKDSPTFKKYITIELSSENQKQILIPQGFAHGFYSLTDNCSIFYKVDNFYSPEHNSGIIWNDKTININWPSDSPLLSEQDQKWPNFGEEYL